jgi:hypothetical protein
MAPPAQTAMVMICLRLRLFSISARRVARGDGDLSDMVASVSVKNSAAAAPPKWQPEDRYHKVICCRSGGNFSWLRCD